MQGILVGVQSDLVNKGYIPLNVATMLGQSKQLNHNIHTERSRLTTTIVGKGGLVCLL